MKSVILTKTILVAAVLALGLTASAQTATTTPAASPPALTGNGPTDPSYSMLGSRYVGVDYGYLRFDQPKGSPRSGHEFGAYYNQAIQPGLDFNASFLDASTGYFRTRPRVDQLMAGVTVYQPVNKWIKPFLSGEAGVAFIRDAQLLSSSGIFNEHNSETRFDYTLAGGVEFQVLPALVASPFISYQEIHQYYHDWNYGVKLSYRIVRAWSVSVSPAIDEHHNLAYQGGVNFHF